MTTRDPTPNVFLLVILTEFLYWPDPNQVELSTFMIVAPLDVVETRPEAHAASESTKLTIPCVGSGYVKKSQPERKLDPLYD